MAPNELNKVQVNNAATLCEMIQKINPYRKSPKGIVMTEYSAIFNHAFSLANLLGDEKTTKILMNELLGYSEKALPSYRIVSKRFREDGKIKVQKVPITASVTILEDYLLNSELGDVISVEDGNYALKIFDIKQILDALHMKVNEYSTNCVKYIGKFSEFKSSDTTLGDDISGIFSDQFGEEDEN